MRWQTLLLIFIFPVCIPLHSANAGDWMAVSYCKTTGNIGYVYRSENETDARQVATAACQFGVVKREGKTKQLAQECCKIIETSNSRCYAVATSLDSRTQVFVARHKVKSQAVTQSMRDCMKVGRFCRMLVIACPGSYLGEKEAEASQGYGIGRALPTSELR